MHAGQHNLNHKKKFAVCAGVEPACCVICSYAVLRIYTMQTVASLCYFQSYLKNGFNLAIAFGCGLEYSSLTT